MNGIRLPGSLQGPCDKDTDIIMLTVLDDGTSHGG